MSRSISKRPGSPVADRASHLVQTLTPTTLQHLIFLNYGRPPLNDLRVRRALNYAIDREELSQVLTYGLMPGTSVLFPKRQLACDPATANFYNYDPAGRVRCWPGRPSTFASDILMLGRRADRRKRQELLQAQVAPRRHPAADFDWRSEQTSAQF